VRKLLILVAGLLLACSLPAQTIAFSSPRAGDCFQAGQIVEVRWGALPEGAEELELLLSTGQPRAFTLRLTEELDADTRSYRWVVPNLAMPEARLVLRVNVEGREVESALSEAFSIAAELSGEGAFLEARAGEIWVQTAAPRADTGSSPFPDAAMGCIPPRIELPPPASAALLAPAAPTAAPRGEASRFDPGRDAGAPTRPSPASRLSRSPLVVPQRI